MALLEATVVIVIVIDFVVVVDFVVDVVVNVVVEAEALLVVIGRIIFSCGQ